MNIDDKLVVEKGPKNSQDATYNDGPGGRSEGHRSLTEGRGTGLD